MGTREYASTDIVLIDTPYAVEYCFDRDFSLDENSASVGGICWNIHTTKIVKDSQNIVESELVFKPHHQAAFSGIWKIEGKLIFTDEATDKKLLEVSFSCSDRQPSHKFESEMLLRKKIDYELHFTNLVGMSVTPRPNYFEANDMTDVCLIVGKGDNKVKLHLSKAVLANFSEYFKAMFFGNFAEKNKSEVELEDVCADDFILLLDLLFGAYLFAEVETDDLFVLADRFAMPVATKKLQSFVMEHYDAYHVITYLIWADKYNLTHLMSRVVENFTQKDMKRLQKRKERHDLRAATLLAVMNAVGGNAKK